MMKDFETGALKAFNFSKLLQKINSVCSQYTKIFFGMQ